MFMNVIAGKIINFANVNCQLLAHSHSAKF